MRVTYDRDDTIETNFSLVVINKTSQNINATLNNNTKSNNNTNPKTTRPPTPKNISYTSSAANLSAFFPSYLRW